MNWGHEDGFLSIGKLHELEAYPKMNETFYNNSDFKDLPLPKVSNFVTNFVSWFEMAFYSSQHTSD